MFCWSYFVLLWLKQVREALHSSMQQENSSGGPFFLRPLFLSHILLWLFYLRPDTWCRISWHLMLFHKTSETLLWDIMVSEQEHRVAVHLQIVKKFLQMWIGHLPHLCSIGCPHRPEVCLTKVRVNFECWKCEYTFSSQGAYLGAPE